jgi:hypothetical protein
MTDKYIRGSKTSRDAWIRSFPDANTQRGRVYSAMFQYRSSGGLTDHEMQQMLAMNPSTQRPRRIELVEGGWVVDSGITRLTPSQREAVVWRITTPSERIIAAAAKTVEAVA